MILHQPPVIRTKLAHNYTKYFYSFLFISDFKVQKAKILPAGLWFHRQNRNVERLLMVENQQTLFN